MSREYREKNFAEVASGIVYSSSQHLAEFTEESHKNRSKAGILAQIRILNLENVFQTPFCTGISVGENNRLLNYY
jgi:hypothetical protein